MIILYILVALIVLIVILGMIAPNSFSMERSINVNVSQEKAFNALKSLRIQSQWSVWGQRDPNQENEYRGTDGEVGAVHFWSGNKDVGEGEQEITALEPNHLIKTELRFLKPFKATNDAWFKIEELGADSSKVSWGFSGDMKFPMNIMMLFMNMEKSLGKDFEQGLQNFKAYVEG